MYDCGGMTSPRKVSTFIFMNAPFTPGARSVILHADDLGMAQATLIVPELLASSPLSSTSIMVPCAWAPAAARALAGRGFDVGVHATMTSEWEACRWRPLTSAATLLDDEGYLPRTCEELWAKADPAEVAAELDAQLTHLERLGVELSHVDAHMGAIAFPSYLDLVVETCVRHRLVPMLPSFTADEWVAAGFPVDAAEAMVSLCAAWRDRGLPLVHIRSLPLEGTEGHRESLLETLASLPEGVTHLYLHPAADTPELSALGGDAAARVANAQVFRDPTLGDDIAHTGADVVTYGQLRDAVPADMWESLAPKPLSDAETRPRRPHRWGHWGR